MDAARWRTSPRRRWLRWCCSFLTHPLQYLPRCVLGAIVFIVAIRLVRPARTAAHSPREPRRISAGRDHRGRGVWWAWNRESCSPWCSRCCALCSTAIIRTPRCCSARTKAGIWQLNPVVPGAVTEPGLVIYRFGAPLFYANAGRFAEEIVLLAGPAPSAVRWLVVDAGAITQVDYTAARVVRELQQRPGKARRRAGVRACAIGSEARLWTAIISRRLSARIGFFTALHEALASYQRLA